MGANVCGPCDRSGVHPGAELAPPVQSVGDNVVQGSVAADEVGAPLDAMGVVASPSSGSRDVPAGKSESTPPSNPGDRLYNGEDVLMDWDEEGPPPPMIEQRPALEQHGGGIAGNAGPPSRSIFLILPRGGVAGSGIAGGPAASNQVHPPRNNVAAIPLPPEDLYFWEYTFEQVQQFQQCDAREDGYCYIAPDRKVFYQPAHQLIFGRFCLFSGE